MGEINRRTAIGGLAVASAAMSAGPVFAAERVTMGTAGQAFAGLHKPKLLRFNPARLDGLSERLITSHWENNYGGSVKTLNLIETKLAAALADESFPPAAYGGLKREELLRTGSVVLHEIYFDILGGNGQPAGGIRQALANAFGSFDRWVLDFKRTALSLGGGSGWVILAFNTHTGQLHNYWSWDHMHAPAMAMPVLVLDMYEHSYQMDYGAAAAKYIDAFFRNVDWEVVDGRYARSLAARV